MANIGKEILERQNQEENLVLLLAQREIYSSAKNIQAISIMLVSVVPVVIAICGYIYPEFSTKFPNIMTGYGIIVVIIEFVLIYLIGKRKELAASVQESFDTNVFGIAKNENLGVLDIDDNTLLKYKNKIDNGENTDELKDWYSGAIIELKTNVAVLFCQRTNVYYDSGIRKQYRIIVVVFCLLIFFTIFLFGLLRDMKLSEFLLKLIFANLPIFIFSCNEIKNQTEAIKNIKDLQDIITKRIDEIGLKSNENQITIRQIQDRIYNNRKINPLMPDCLYKLLRNKSSNNLEQEMNFSISRKIKEMKIKEQENIT